MKSGPDSDLKRTARRIGIQTAALVVVCLAAVGALVYGTVVESQHRQTTQTLTAAAASAGSRGGRERDDDQDSAGRRDNRVLVAVLHDGRILASSATPAGLPDAAVMATVARTGISDRRTVDLRTGRYDVLTVRQGSDVVQAAVNLIEEHQEQERILSALGIGGAVGVVLSALLGALLARRAVQPMATALSLQRRFVADAGHELRTPLTLLSTRAQLLRRRILAAAPEPVVADRNLRDLDGIVADTHALTDILEELLLAADTRTPVPHDPVDLTAIVTAAVSAAQASAETSQITLTLEAHPSATLAAGAPAALTRAVTALIDNAVSHAERQVQVKVEQRGSQVAIEVADDGPGISEATLPRMFDRFSSDRDQTPDSVRHYGLGLSLVNEVATRHGGTVHADNRPPPDRGAVLTLLVPR